MSRSETLLQIRTDISPQTSGQHLFHFLPALDMPVHMLFDVLVNDQMLLAKVHLEQLFLGGHDEKIAVDNVFQDLGFVPIPAEKDFKHIIQGPVKPFVQAHEIYYFS